VHVSNTAELQLDRAEFDGTSGATCGVCATTLTTQYYEANGVTVCAACCEKVRAVGTAGTSLTRAMRALGAGAAAALAGSILYYAILALSGYEFGLIAIAVGMVVGKAVNWGAYGRGGWRYQTMAIALTYLAIVSSYVPLIIGEMGKQPVAAEASAKPGETTIPVAQTQTADEAPPTAAGAIAAIALLIGLLLALPFLGGLQNIMGLIIIGIGLYEAWKFNRKGQVTITGPHAIASVPAV
jgi:hypothetical protein